VKPAVFSHWSHRLRYTCRVCHLELDFAMKRNGTEITEESNRKGLFCGACHNGRTAFAHTEANCVRCHNGDERTGCEGFSKLEPLPRSKFGNGVDWSAAIASGKITPAASLSKDFEVMTLDTTLSLEADWAMVPPAVFPHAEHTRWLDCANCHPAVFNIKKKTTQHFSMSANLAGEFCGACHLNVAFPLDDCKRCHPKMKGY
jgi:c(7)-type cytochrome triheme protein